MKTGRSKTGTRAVRAAREVMKSVRESEALQRAKSREKIMPLSEPLAAEGSQERQSKETVAP
jgi:hypothetical protein